MDSGQDGYEPQHKHQHNGENLTKFSVEIVQQLEFTTSAANSQPQQISTNVTVKALTNTSVKTEGGGNNGGTNANNGNQSGCNQNNTKNSNHTQSPSPHQSHNNDIENLVECKQEPDHEFADLELSDLYADNTNDESDTFKELISDLSDFHPELLDFEEKPLLEIKTEDGCKQEMLSHGMMDGMGVNKGNSPLTQYSSTYSDNNQMNKQRGPYNSSNGSGAPMSELSPAAQTLKHMAEQHQHKNAIGMGYHPRPPPQSQPNPSRGPPGGYGGDFGPYNGPEYINNGPGPNSVPQFHKGGPPFDIKQEMMYSSQMPNQAKMGPSPYSKQQYSPYGSPGSMSNHGSPGPNYMPGPRGPGPGTQGPGGPSRPPSGPGAGNQGSTTLQMKQTQQLHINQQGNGGHGIQVSLRDYFFQIII